LPWNLIPSLRGRPLVVAPSATAWLAAAGKHSPRDTIGVSAFAGPGLHHAEAEAKAVGRCWPGATVFSAGAQRQHLRDALTSSSIVHIAAHGRHEPENPLFSSIRLADGVVYAYEFRPTEYFAEHVVLSACELGQSTIRAGDETLGLTSALLRLGARSVISSVAKVHDEVAAQTMLRYHNLLAAGNNTATALAAATEAATDVPAPFVCFGSAWQTRAQA
jgi:CHAT domain-containing protein